MDKEVQNLQLKRTNWSLPMDRYFIKLLVEQYHNGQYHDGQFTKHAWKCMTDHFGAKFGPNHNIEVLKNHYRGVKRSHTAIKALLKESGFRWDGDREMVTADDDVWDDYIKTHRDVQVWRTKSVLGYDDLCQIFGDGGATGRYSLAPGDNDLRKEKTSMENGEPVNVQQPPSPVISNEDPRYDDTRETRTLDGEVEAFNESERILSTLPPNFRDTKRLRRSTEESIMDAIPIMASAIPGMDKEVQNLQLKRTNWSLPMDRYFIKLLVEQYHNGQYHDGQFTKHAWKCMADQFGEKFGPNHNIEVLKNHYRCVKRSHTAIKALLKESEFRWDGDREMVAADDDVWDAYIKTHRDAQIWRTKSVFGYADLCTIFGDGGATGRYSLAPGDIDLRKEKASMENGEPVNVHQAPSPVIDSDDPSYDTQETRSLDAEVEALNESEKLQSKIPPNSRSIKRPRRSTEEGIMDAIPIMASTVPGMASGRYSLASGDSDLSKEKSSMRNGEHVNVQRRWSSIIDGEDPCYDTQEPASLDGDFEAFNQSKRSPSTVPSKTHHTKKPRRSTEVGMVDAIPGMATAIQGMASAIHGMASVITVMANKKRDSHNPSHRPTYEGKLIAALEAVPEIDNLTFMRAIDFLEDEKKANIFVELSVERRREWLLYKLRKD